MNEGGHIPLLDVLHLGSVSGCERCYKLCAATTAQKTQLAKFSRGLCLPSALVCSTWIKDQLQLRHYPLRAPVPRAHLHGGDCWVGR